ncbi:Putative insecticidal toxin complex [uncultured Gammaproteobacteria bacterium]|nr:Putative insecticidal toxin complex [uncultured Gammaproteobacteria bacterium]
MNLLELYQQTYTYDTGNNLTQLLHQANSSTWQQTLAIHPNNNRGTETQQSTTDFDANGNLLTLDNIGALDWHYNNTLNQLTKADKNNTIQYYVYDCQNRRVRTVIESNNQAQSQRDYLPVLDISTNEAKKQINTLHIGTHILRESSKDNTQNSSPNFTQTRYQLTSHLQSNTLELDDKAQVISYENYYPYGGTAIIAGKDKTEVQQKRYRYTDKERDDNSSLSYYGTRYLAPWLARWISPDSTGAVDGLNLYVYVGNNPLKYIDPTGNDKIGSISWNEFIAHNNNIKGKRRLNLWVGENHAKTSGAVLMLDLVRYTNIQDIMIENTAAKLGQRPSKDINIVNHMHRSYSAPHETQEIFRRIQLLTISHNTYYVGTHDWKNTLLDVNTYGPKNNYIAFVGSNHIAQDIKTSGLNHDLQANPAYRHTNKKDNIALLPLEQVEAYRVKKRVMKGQEYGIWVKDRYGIKGSAFLVLGSEDTMKREFGDAAQPVPEDLSKLQDYRSEPRRLNIIQAFLSIFNQK